MKWSRLAQGLTEIILTGLLDIIKYNNEDVMLYLINNINDLEKMCLKVRKEKY